MATPRKGESRRVGFSVDEYGNPVTDGRDGAWSDGVRHFGQWTYLHTLSRMKPAVLQDLAALMPDEQGAYSAPALDAWAAKWGLLSSDPSDPWPIAYARATLRGWDDSTSARGCYWFDRDDVSGILCPEDPPQQSRPLKNPEHFSWLVQRQTGTPWSHILGTMTSDRKSIREAVNALAAALCLQVRTANPGRPPRA